MALEVEQREGGAILRASAQVSVTIVHVGKRGYAGGGEKTTAKMTGFEQKVLEGAFVGRTGKVMNPSGHLSFRSLIYGLPVVRLTSWSLDDRSGVLVVTPGGSVIRLEPHMVAFSKDLNGQAERAGLLAWQGTQRRLAELERGIISEQEARQLAVLEPEQPDGALSLGGVTAAGYRSPDGLTPLDDLTERLRASFGGEITAFLRADGQVLIRGGRDLDAAQRRFAAAIVEAWRHSQ